MKKFNPQPLENERGMALLMVISTIAILTALLADFTFETKLHQIKAYNAQDRAQARLTAEAGIHFSLAKLRIYQEVRNKLEQNKNLKAVVKPQQLESILTQPFVYPVPLPPKASNIQKSALQDFEEGTVLKGNLNITMSQVTGFLNPNNLRIPVPQPQDTNQGRNQSRDQDRDPDDPNQGDQKSPMEVTEEKLLQLLTEELRLRREQDNLFDQLYPTLEPRMLVKELKFYVNNPQALQDPEIPEIQSIYTEKGLVAKHAPMTSLEEMYTLAGWPEVVVNMVKDRLSVHEVGFISLNNITENTLRLLFPNITPEQSEEFFRHRDGDPDLGEAPKPFQSVEDFKNLVVNQLAIVSSTDFDQRQKEFEAANLRFGVAGKLYKVQSTARYNTATVKITAFIDLPVKPQPPPAPQNPNGNPNNPNDPNNPNGQNPGGQPVSPPPPSPNNKKPEFKLELMLPRIVEIRMD